MANRSESESTATIPAPTVTPTSTKNVYRVSFVETNKDAHRSYITTFAFIEDGKIQIAYSHHTHHSRSSTIAPWNEYAQVRIPLTPIMTSLIRSNVALALADHFIGSVIPLPPGLLDKADDDDNTVI